MDPNFYFERNIKRCHHSTTLLQDHSLPGFHCSHICWLRPESIFMRFDPKFRSVEAPRIWHPIHQKVHGFSILLWLAGKNLEKRTQCSVYVSAFSVTLAMRTWRFEGGGSVMVSPFLPSHLPCGARSGLACLGTCLHTHAGFPFYIDPHR